MSDRAWGLAGLRGNRWLRSIDRYVGIPLVAAAGIMRRKRALPDPVRRIGAINSTNIGDTILLSAALKDLGAARSGAEVILFASPAAMSLAPMLPELRMVPISIGSPTTAVRALRRERLDVLLDFDQWPRVEPIYSLLSGARWSAGFRSPGQFRHLSYDHFVDHSDQVHELDNYRRLVAALGAQAESVPQLRARGELAAEQLPDGPFVVLHLWPSGFNRELKEWRWDRWRDLAAELHTLGLKIVLTGSASDMARAAEFIDYCRGGGFRLIDTCGRLNLAELVDLLSASRCVISVNTGVMHLAAASGAPTVALNGPTSATRWGPVGSRAQSVNSSFSGCGYLHFGWEYKDQRADCMLGITVAQVVGTVHKVMSL